MKQLKIIKQPKKKKKIRERIRKSDDLIAICGQISQRPKTTSIYLYKRIFMMLSSCRTRDKKYGKETLITVSMLVDLIKKYIGKQCKYCNVVLDHKNISMDHIIPLSGNGTSEIENIQFICKNCNKQKDKMLDNEFRELKDLIKTFSDESQKYVNKKLSMQGGFNGFYKKEKQQP